MRSVCLTISLCLTTAFCWAQGSIEQTVNQAEEYILGGKYIYAIQLLEEVLTQDENDTRALFDMGEALRHSFEYEKAEAFYRKVAFIDSEKYPRSMYYLALMEKFNGKYNAAARHFAQFIETNKGSSNKELIEQARIEKAGSEMAIEYRGKERFIATMPGEPVNSAYNDYASATRADNSMIITSSRVTRQNKRVDQRFGEALAEQYLMNKDQSLWSADEETVKAIRNKYNDASGSFTRDGTRYYFTACGLKVRECQIYYSEIDTKGGFSSPEALPKMINYPGFDSKQPGISPSGDTLFYVSNRPGGIGGNDIWASSKSENGEWQTPRNLGPAVNTPMNENSPNVAMNHILLFSSSGHQGFGGMDLFMARKMQNGDTSLVNLGFPFNSSRDDMFPDLSDRTFRWSSNLPAILDGFNIYETDIASRLSFTSLLNIYNRDASRRSALKNPREAREISGSYATIVNKGELSFELLPPEEQRAIDALAMGDNTGSVVLQKWAQGQIDVLVSERRKHLELLDKRRLEKKLPLANTSGSYELYGKIACLYCEGSPEVRLEDLDHQPLQISGMDENGHFRFTGIAQEQTVAIQVDSEAPGIITIEHVEYKFQSDILEFAYTPVFFRLAESIVEDEFIPIFNGLAAYLNQNPDMHLEIVAHADNTGSAKYNDFLTRERGNVVYKKLLSLGVSPTSMMVRAKGFREPSASNDTPLGRQQNRRVEFALTGKGYSPDLTYQVCFTKEAMNQESLEDLLNEENLIDVNRSILSQNPRAHMPVVTPVTHNTDKLVCPTSHLNK